MQHVDSQPQLEQNIRARRRVMADNREASGDSEEPQLPQRLPREDPIPGITRTPSMFSRMRTETYQEIGAILQEVYSSPAKFLLVFVPAGVIAGLLHFPAVTVFLLNFVALVPLAALILYSILVFTEDFALLGGLLRAIFGNATELILGISALLRGKAQLAQWIMVGSILTYCLFVLGGSFLVASYGKKKESFSKSRTSIMSSLVMGGAVCLTIPTVMGMVVEEKKGQQSILEINVSDDVNNDPLFLSRVTSIVQIVLFLAYLIFRFRTHNRIFPQNSNAPHLSQTSSTLSLGARSNRSGQIHLKLALVSLVALVCTAICANYLVGSLTGATKTLGVSESFAALVVLPQAGSLIKAVTIIRHTRSSASALPSGMSRLDFAIRSIMTNIFDTQLFILPMLVLLSWAVGQPMNLSFGLFEAVIFLMAIMTMTYLVQHGKTTYFEGIMLMGTYLTIVIALYVRPDVTKTSLSTLGSTNSE